jgi:hypothetical protein
VSFDNLSGHYRAGRPALVEVVKAVVDACLDAWTARGGAATAPLQLKAVRFQNFVGLGSKEGPQPSAPLTALETLAEEHACVTARAGETGPALSSEWGPVLDCGGWKPFWSPDDLTRYKARIELVDALDALAERTSSAPSRRKVRELAARAGVVLDDG